MSTYDAIVFCSWISFVGIYAYELCQLTYLCKTINRSNHDSGTGKHRYQLNARPSTFRSIFETAIVGLLLHGTGLKQKKKQQNCDDFKLSGYTHTCCGSLRRPGPVDRW